LTASERHTTPTGTSFFYAASHVNATNGTFQHIDGDQHIHTITSNIDPGMNKLTIFMPYISLGPSNDIMIRLGASEYCLLAVSS